jgi:hypothetical protein
MIKVKAAGIRHTLIRPGFICVGPEKTGSSWLYRNLKWHPEIYLPPINEIRSFYNRYAYPGEGLRDRFSARGDWHVRQYRGFLRKRFRYYLRHPHELLFHWQRTKWDLRFLFGSRNDGWYLSLFDPAGERLAGEVSPQYFSCRRRRSRGSIGCFQK